MMNFIKDKKLVLGIFIFLITLFIIPLSSFHQSILGKILLIFLIIYFSWSNIFLGLISVIIFVLMYKYPFNSYNNTFLSQEPFTGTMTMIPDPSCNCINSYDASGNCISLYDSSGNCIRSYDASGNYIGTIYEQAKRLLMTPKEIMFDISGNIDIKQHATEGFNLLETEDSIRKGKQSNSIIVNKNAKNNSILFPFENSKFIENFMIL